MSHSSPNAAIQYAAEIENVREVTLHATADLSYWRGILKQEELFPYNSNGSAEVLISATNAKWKGFKFREFIIVVAVCDDEDEVRQDGYYLAHAFNSKRLFAFSERFFFQTPYYQGDIEVEDQVPSSIKLRDKDELLFSVEMMKGRTPSNVEYEEWKGPIFLPRKMTKKNQFGGKFFAMLSGETKTYPFSPEMDRVEISPSGDHEVFQQLVESGFAVNKWAIRSNAAHAKSKTYKRDFNGIE